MKNLIKTFYILVVLLSGCQTVSNVNIDPKKAQNYILPYQPTAGKAVVYLTQPYEFTDANLVFGTLGEGISYNSTRAYVKSGTHNYYLGNLHRSTLCFYADPGNYQLTFNSSGVSPEVITHNVQIQPNSVNFVGLQSDDIGKTIQYKTLSPLRGKAYVQQTPPKTCQTLESFIDDDKRHVILSFKFTNNTNTPINVTAKDNRKLFLLLPGVSGEHSQNSQTFIDVGDFSLNLQLQELKGNRKNNLVFTGRVAELNKTRNYIRSFISTPMSMSLSDSSLRTHSICKASYERLATTIRCMVSLYDVKDPNDDKSRLEYGRL